MWPNPQFLAKILKNLLKKSLMENFIFCAVICLISFNKLSELLPAPTSARVIDNLWSIGLKSCSPLYSFILFCIVVNIKYHMSVISKETYNFFSRIAKYFKIGNPFFLFKYDPTHFYFIFSFSNSVCFFSASSNLSGLIFMSSKCFLES